MAANPERLAMTSPPSSSQRNSSRSFGAWLLLAAILVAVPQGAFGQQSDAGEDAAALVSFLGFTAGGVSSLAESPKVKELSVPQKARQASFAGFVRLPAGPGRAFPDPDTPVSYTHLTLPTKA